MTSRVKIAGWRHRASILGSQAVLLAYSVLMLSSYWSQLTDIETTLRLVGSDVGCSLSAINCNWLNFTIEKIVGVVVISLGVSSVFSRNVHRDRIAIGAAILAGMHLATLWLLLSPA